MTILPSDSEPSTPTPEEREAARAAERQERADADRARRAADAVEQKWREEAFELAGSLDGYLAVVEDRRSEMLNAAKWSGARSKADKVADERVAWGREKAKQEREHRTMLAQRARVDAAVKDYKDWLSDGGDRARFLWPDDGFSNLQGLADWFGNIERTAPNEETQALRFIAWRKACDEAGADVGENFLVEPDDEEREHFEPAPKPWVIGQDREWLVPLSQSSLAREEYARRWRDSQQHFRGQEVVVFLPPGEPLCFAVWSSAPVWGRQYLRALCGDDEGEPRFTSPEFPWWLPDDRVYLPSAHAEAKALLPSASTFARDTPAAKLLTGVNALDALFRGKPGVPVGAKVLVAGQKKNCKTLTALELAESALLAGWVVLWLAIDEPASDIMVRRLQRAGLSEADAQDLPEDALNELDANGSFFACADPLEEAWETAHGSAGGTPLMIVIDSLQTVRSAASHGKGEREGLEALISAIGECQSKWPALVVATSEVNDRSNTPKGTGRIGYSFTTLLAVKRTGEQLTLTAKDGRDHRDGAVELAVDFAGQRLLDPKVAAGAKASAELRARILAAVAKLGAKATGQRIEQEVGGRATTVRDEIKAMVADGSLVPASKRTYRLP